MSRSGSPHDLRRLDSATAHLDAPFAIVDMAAFRANAAAMTRRAGGKPIRLASKSVRCRHLIEQVLAMDGYRGRPCLHPARGALAGGLRHQRRHRRRVPDG